MKKYDFSIIIAVHRRINAVDLFIKSIEKNTVANVQLVVCGDRSFLPSVDTESHMSVTDYFKSRGDFEIITPSTPIAPVEAKYVFLESESTRYLINNSSPERRDLPAYNHMYLATSDAIPYCNSDLILGPAEDDLYFIKGWDTGFLEAVKMYDPQMHVYIHREYNANHCLPDFRPSKYPLTCQERHELISSSPYMTDITTIHVDDIEKWGERHRGNVMRVEDILPKERGWPLSEGGPFLIHRDVLTKIGGYTGIRGDVTGFNYTDNKDRVFNLYGDPMIIPDALYRNDVRKIVQPTNVVIFHNHFKQNIIGLPGPCITSKKTVSESEPVQEGSQFPQFVHVVLSYACNSQCIMCPYTGDLRKKKAAEMGTFMNPDIFFKIVDECSKNNSFLRITGGGEPLLHPGIVEMMHVIRAKNVRAGIITNGSLLTGDNSVALLLANCVIEISVDSADKETYERVRKNLSWSGLIDNIVRLKALRTQTGSKSPIIVSMVHQKGVDIEAAKQFWEKFADNVIIRKYLTWGVMSNEQSADTRPLTEDQSAPCPYLFQRITIDLDGSIRMCNYDILGKISLGNIRDMNTTIKEVWNGDRLKESRKLMMERKWDQLELCRGCADRLYRSWNYDYRKVVRDAERKLTQST